MVIQVYDNFDKFKNQAEKIGIEEEVDELLSIHTPIYHRYKKYSILVLPISNEKNIISIIHKKGSISYPSIPKIDSEWLKEIGASSNSENTLVFFNLLEHIISIYDMEYYVLKSNFTTNKEINLDTLERVRVDINILREKVEDVLKILIKFKSNKDIYINAMSILYDIDVLIADANYLYDMLKLSLKEISVRRNIYEVEVSKELNSNIVKLTEIMLILTVLSIIISVPNTIATIFGVGPLANLVSANGIIELIVASTIISLIITYIYFKFIWRAKK
jgi:Mg2+ and Co2+ transporter CorA